MLGDRFKEAIAHNNLSVNKLAQLIGMGQTTLNDQLRGRTTLTPSTIELILPYLTNISAEWLLRGEGAMERGIVSKIVGRLNSCGDGDIFNESPASDNAELRKRVSDLEKEKAQLLDIISNLTKR